MMESGKVNCWNRLKDSVGNMDVAQIQFVMSQESVKNVYSEMMGAFNSFLFEKFKEDIIQKISQYDGISDNPKPDVFSKEIKFNENRVKVKRQ